MNAARNVGSSPRRRVGLLAVALLLMLAACGCAAQVYQREHLVDRIMSFDTQTKNQMRQMKLLEAREGSTGGAGGAGGGCACN